jgi:hypothetical protein
MNNRFTRVAAAMAALSITAVSTAAGLTPIRNGHDALRAALSGYYTGLSAPSHVDTITSGARDFAKSALLQLAASTTPAALSAAPITLPCAASGSIRATLTAGWPRVLRLEWQSCGFNILDEVVSTLNGPAELVLPGNSLTPSHLLSLRFGDRSRDFVIETPARPGDTRIGDSDGHWNLRATGIIPFGDQDETFRWFLGRFAYELNGFYRKTEHFWSRPVPGPPFYPQVQTFTAQNVIVSGDFVTEGRVKTRAMRGHAGTVSWRIETPTTPTRNGHVSTQTYRFQDLRTITVYDYTGEIGRQSIRLDGRAEVNLAETAGLAGCTHPETWEWRTRTPMSNEFRSTDLQETGDLSINGRVDAKFRLTGFEPFVDMVGYIDLKARGLGDFTFASPFTMQEFTLDAGCAP